MASSPAIRADAHQLRLLVKGLEPVSVSRPWKSLKSRVDLAFRGLGFLWRWKV